MTDIPITQRSSTRCSALAETGVACGRLAMPGSQFCLGHALAATAAERQMPDASEEPSASETTPTQAGNIDELAINDRLTSARSPEGRAQAANARAANLNLFGRAAQRLVSPGVPTPNADEVDRFLRRSLGRSYDQIAGSMGEYLDPDVLKGMGYVASYLAREQMGSARRRLTGNYETDDFGRDRAFMDALMPLAQAFYDSYWRVDVTGTEHIPDSGRAMLVSNHSGVLPFDGLMLGLAVYNNTPSQRLMRALVAAWFPTVPFVSIFLQKTGGVQANPHNAQLLLEQEELVAVFPEGTKGVGKLYRDRYQLQRFGRGGFVKVALRTGAPIIPVAVVGAEEIYPVIARVEPLARLLGMPFFPITPFFPLTGPLGFVPLPTKWSIDFGAPIPVEEYGPRAAVNPAIVSRLTQQVRSAVQQMLLDRLARRRSVFMGED